MTVRRLKPSKPPAVRHVARDVLRQRAASAVMDRIPLLEAIADGALGWTYATNKRKPRKDGGETLETTQHDYQPTARDRIAALELLAKLAGLHEPSGAESGNSAAWRSAEALSRALLGALSDPAVRRWLAAERPEVLGALTAGALGATVGAVRADAMAALPPGDAVGTE